MTTQNNLTNLSDLSNAQKKAPGKRRGKHSGKRADAQIRHSANRAHPFEQADRIGHSGGNLWPSAEQIPLGLHVPRLDDSAAEKGSKSTADKFQPLRPQRHSGTAWPCQH